MSPQLFVLATILALAAAHGRLWEPIARTAIHMRPEFPTSQPYWWDSSGVWCGNVQQDTTYSTCGRCGDTLGETTANQGGIYDKGVIVATYTSGAIVEMAADIDAPHNGHFEVELCPQEVETDDCFRKLQIVGANNGEEVRDGNRVCVLNAQKHRITARVQLPSGVRCERCTIRWTYRTSYGGRPDWDYCDNPYPTQTFRNCADVQIV